MELEMKVDGDTLLVRVTGELDLEVAESLRRELDLGLDKEGTHNLTLDLNGVSFIDSSGLGVILGRYRRLIQNGGRLIITGARPSIKRILQISGIDRLMLVYPTVEEPGARGGLR